MKTLQEIKQFYEGDLRRDREQLQVKQIKRLRTARLLQAVFLCLVVLGFVFLYRWTEYLLGSLIAAFFLYVSVFFWIRSRLSKNLIHDHWNNIIQQTIQFTDNKLTYSSQEGIPKQVFQESQIFLNELSRYTASHLVCGHVDGTMITSSYIDVKEPTRCRVPQTQLFMGTVFCATLNQTLCGRTVLVPTDDIQVNTFGKVTRAIMQPVEPDIESWPRRRDPVIEGHNTDFERLFVIHGNKPEHTKTLLKRTLMQTIVKYKIATNKHLLLSFTDSHLFLACQHQFNPFDYSLRKSTLSFDAIQDYFEDLAFFMRLVAEVNSNSK